VIVLLSLLLASVLVGLVVTVVRARRDGRDASRPITVLAAFGALAILAVGGFWWSSYPAGRVHTVAAQVSIVSEDGDSVCLEFPRFRGAPLGALGGDQSRCFATDGLDEPPAGQLDQGDEVTAVFVDAEIPGSASTGRLIEVTPR
jgi:hypothetical protein